MSLRFDVTPSTAVPGSQVPIGLTVTNVSGTPVRIERVCVETDWHACWTWDGPWQCAAGRSIPIGPLSLPIPADVVGLRGLDFSFRASFGWGSIWQEPQDLCSDGPMPLLVRPQPEYRLFLSRSVRPEDAALLDAGAARLADWGFVVRTVGVAPLAVDPARPSPEVLHEIALADAFVAVATPRDPLVSSGTWSAPEWLHGETGLAFGQQKAILVLHADCIEARGLLGQFDKDTYRTDDVGDLLAKIDSWMPAVRIWIAQERRSERTTSFIRWGTGILAVATVVGVAYAVGKDSCSCGKK